MGGGVKVSNLVGVGFVGKLIRAVDEKVPVADQFICADLILCQAGAILPSSPKSGTGVGSGFWFS